MIPSELPEEVRIATECSAALYRGEKSAARRLAEQGLALANASGSPKWIRRFQHLLRTATDASIADAPYRPPVCSFCSRESRNVVAGPKTYICDECVKACSSDEPTGLLRSVMADDLSCSFCGSRPSEPLFTGREYCICRTCVVKCAEIFAG
jgi:ClpX C4-type zinc finger